MNLVSAAILRKFLTAVLLLPIPLAIAQAPSPDLQPPEFRLPAGAAPTQYKVDLTLAPDKDTFAGVIEISVKFAQATTVLWLNAQNLTIQEAVLDYGGRKMNAKVLPQKDDFVGFAFDHAVEPGEATLRISYEGQVSRKDMEGIFQRKDGDHWYVYTQFENIAARKAFPCFDEPGFKVPWQLTLHVPKEFGAYSNTPMTSEADGPKGTKTVKFAQTKPLPSYLVTLAVGPFDVLNGRDAGTNKTKVRILYPKGHPGEAAYEAKITPDILEYLERYFGIPYPYEKLDEVAIPLAGYAMEHPGLVTYGSGFFLLKEGSSNLSLLRGAASVTAHELAHQWFGDLVTTAWWDDTWLNEGFASWMGDKVLGQYHPEWKVPIDDLNTIQEAMRKDELLSSRKVRQPIENNNDITNAFDNITYDKGNAVLAMFESYIGPEVFRKRIHEYLVKYSYRNATSSEFLSEIAGGDAETIAALSTFLDQPGVPVVNAELQCNAGKASLALAQKRFLPRGSQPKEEQLWNIPVCVRYPSGAGEQRECTLMKGKSATMALTHSDGCPAWFYGNADEASYYRVAYSADGLKAIVQAKGKLTLNERVGFLGNLVALTRSSMLRGEALGIVPAFAHDASREVVTKTTDITAGLDRQLVPEELRPAYHRYLSDLYKERAEQLGTSPKAGESEDDKILRPILFEMMASEAQDPEFLALAKKLATDWLQGKAKPDPNTFQPAISAAAEHGDRELFDLLHAAAKKETVEDVRYAELYALGQFRDPAILHDALTVALSDEFDPRFASVIFGGATGWPTSQDLLFQFMKENWDALIARTPVDVAGYLPGRMKYFCDAEHLAAVKEFFGPRVAKVEGGPRTLDQVVEGIGGCITSKQANQPSVVEFFQKY